MLLTEADRAILRAVQQDAGVTITELAAQVNLSPSAAQRRLQRLREAKVILRDVALVDPKRVGGGVSLLVELELERERPELLPSLHQWIGKMTEVQQAWRLTGRGDYTLVIVTDSIERFDEFTTRMMAENANIRKFTTSVVLTHIKTGLMIPV